MFDEFTDTISASLYVKHTIDIGKHNSTIYSIPSMYRLARSDEKKFFCETYLSLTVADRKNLAIKKYKGSSTIPGNKTVLENFNKYLLPNIYNVTLIDDYLLSPVYKSNKIFYIYHNAPVGLYHTRLFFKPRIKNTQLVKGYALIENATGRITEYEFSGEYDMAKFDIKVKMGDSSTLSFIPEKCVADMKISYLGNKIFLKTVSLCDTSHIETRPVPLDIEEKRILDRHDSISSIKKTEEKPVSASVKKTKYILWDVIGDNLINRIKANFGEDDKGYFRIGPIFNPLYFGYSSSKGIVYKLKMNAEYKFTSNSDIGIRLKLGYSFKQGQLYYNIPLRYSFDKKNKGYIQVDFGNGNRITNSSVLEKIKEESNTDSIDFQKMNLDYFKDLSLKIVCNYDFTEKIGLQGGFKFHRRSAVNPKAFEFLDKPRAYKTFAPLIQLQYRPWGYRGAILTADYEHGMKNTFGGDIDYDRWEFDGSYILSLPCTRALSFKAGIGFYSSKGTEQYFLDYENFQDNNIPNGWNDDWMGEFDLLNSNWYNASDYYLRLNMAYESPFMLISWLPKIGQIIEKERLYAGILSVRRLHPYVEFGYGFTNRLFSMGIFTGFSNKRYEGIGFKFGLELFNNW